MWKNKIKLIEWIWLKSDNENECKFVKIKLKFEEKKYFLS